MFQSVIHHTRYSFNLLNPQSCEIAYRYLYKLYTYTTAVWRRITFYLFTFLPQNHIFSHKVWLVALLWLGFPSCIGLH